MNNIFIYGLGFLNCLSFILMAYDKRASIKNKQRISEATFMVMTLFGGIVGIVLSALMFNHKVSKRSFQIKIGFMFMLFIILVYSFMDLI